MAENTKSFDSAEAQSDYVTVAKRQINDIMLPIGKFGISANNGAPDGTFKVESFQLNMQVDKYKNVQLLEKSLSDVFGEAVNVTVIEHDKNNQIRIDSAGTNTSPDDVIQLLESSKERISQVGQSFHEPIKLDIEVDKTLLTNEASPIIPSATDISTPLDGVDISAKRQNPYPAITARLAESNEDGVYTYEGMNDLDADTLVELKSSVYFLNGDDKGTLSKSYPKGFGLSGELLDAYSFDELEELAKKLNEINPLPEPNDEVLKRIENYDLYFTGGVKTPAKKPVLKTSSETLKVSVPEKNTTADNQDITVEKPEESAQIIEEARKLVARLTKESFDQEELDKKRRNQDTDYSQTQSPLVGDTDSTTSNNSENEQSAEPSQKEMSFGQKAKAVGVAAVVSFGANALVAAAVTAACASCGVAILAPILTTAALTAIQVRKKQNELNKDLDEDDIKTGFSAAAKEWWGGKGSIGKALLVANVVGGLVGVRVGEELVESAGKYINSDSVGEYLNFQSDPVSPNKQTLNEIVADEITSSPREVAAAQIPQVIDVPDLSDTNPALDGKAHDFLKSSPQFSSLSANADVVFSNATSQTSDNLSWNEVKGTVTYENAAGNEETKEFTVVLKGNANDSYVDFGYDPIGNLDPSDLPWNQSGGSSTLSTQPSTVPVYNPNGGNLPQSNQIPVYNPNAATPQASTLTLGSSTTTLVSTTPKPTVGSFLKGFLGGGRITESVSNLSETVSSPVQSLSDATNAVADNQHLRTNPLDTISNNISNTVSQMGDAAAKVPDTIAAQTNVMAGGASDLISEPPITEAAMTLEQARAAEHNAFKTVFTLPGDISDLGRQTADELSLSNITGGMFSGNGAAATSTSLSTSTANSASLIAQNSTVSVSNAVSSSFASQAPNMASVSELPLIDQPASIQEPNVADAIKAAEVSVAQASSEMGVASATLEAIRAGQEGVLGDQLAALKDVGAQMDGTLANDPEFQKALKESGINAATDFFGEDPQNIKDFADFIDSDGFEKLSPAQQQQFLNAQPDVLASNQQDQKFSDILHNDPNHAGDDLTAALKNTSSSTSISDGASNVTKPTPSRSV